MTIDNYLKELSSSLKNLPKKDREEILDFYREFAEDGNMKSYEEMVERFGTPQSLSSKIYADSAIKTINSNKKENGYIGKAFIIGMAALFSLPFTFPIAVATLAIVFALLVIIITVLFSFGIVWLVLTKVAIVLFINSFIFLNPFVPGIWLKYFGASLFLFGIVIAIISGTIFVINWILKKITILVSKIVKRSTDNV